MGLGLALVAVISVASKKHNSASNKNKEPSLRGDSGSSGNNLQSRISSLFSPPTPSPTSSPTQSPTPPPTNNPTGKNEGSCFHSLLIAVLVPFGHIFSYLTVSLLFC